MPLSNGGALDQQFGAPLTRCVRRVLFTIAWFLFTYHGDGSRDYRAGKVAWISALCVALFPNSGTKLEQ
jgi:hypothetical protein